MIQKGFAPIIFLVGILVVGLSVVGVWYLKIIQIPNLPPPGCYYQKVQCIKAPCNPILVCDTALPSPTITPQILKPSPSAITDEAVNTKKLTLQGFLRYQTPYPADTGNEYLLELKTPFTDEFSAAGRPEVQYRVEAASSDSTVKNELKKYIGKEVTLEGSMEWGQAESRYLSVKKVYPISKFLSTKEMINALDIYKSSQLDSDELRLLPNFSWPKLKSFKSGDKTREVYLVDCKVTNDKVGIDLIGIPIEVPNVPNIAEVTLKKLMEGHYGEFPNKEDIAAQKKIFNVTYKNPDIGINGVSLKDGNLTINFYDSVRAYGGGSSRVGCMGLSTELTAKQFPTIKSVTMCIDRYGGNDNCSLDFQP